MTMQLQNNYSKSNKERKMHTNLKTKIIKEIQWFSLAVGVKQFPSLFSSVSSLW
jgi:hypothetical protein